MRRVLIVTSSYFPTMIADMHRARQLAWELPKLGWEVEILCPDVSFQPPSCVDVDSAAFFPTDTPTHAVVEPFPAVFRKIGLGSIGWRAIVPLFLAGRRLLKEKPFDIIYISTTQFSLFLLGTIFRKLFKTPFVLDFHDPCYKEDSRLPVWARPSLKHSLSRWLAKYIEALAATAASGLVSVSPNYVEELTRRYETSEPGWLAPGRHAVLPFAGARHDLDEAAKRHQASFVRKETSTRIVYVGAGGPIMVRSFSLFCAALCHLRAQSPEVVQDLEIDLYGTMLGWKEGEPRHMADVARECGVADLIREEPGRVTYRRSLELLLESDGALVLGVDDGGYMPSKLFNYALSGKPLLASLRRESPAFSKFQGEGSLGNAIWFSQSSEMSVIDAANEVKTFLRDASARKIFDRSITLEPCLAPAMARRHAELFEACL
jgi:hypothetical protein